MEHTLNAKDIKNLSMVFRSVAGRFLRSDVDEVAGNLRRLVSCIDSSPVLYEFICKNHTGALDIERIVAERKHNGTRRFVLPENEAEEISFTYQLLKYAATLDSLFGLTYGYNGLKVKADFEGFAHSVVAPFVNHINRYLESLLEEMGRAEGGTTTITVSGSVGQLNFAQHGSTVIATNSLGTTQAVSKAAERLLEVLATETNEGQYEDLKEAAQITLDESKSENPRKGIFKMCLESLPGLLENLPKATAAVKAGHELVQAIRQWISGS